ncbi:hypothetical protein EWW49_00365 [Pseudomonas syringae]|uniref:hypothetical protein n=1 Tax=Pseudomonas sp. MWU16-30316 TaxID=2878093 RepID=UPI001100FC97|nr:hypothetical protein [Pseudomonas sp. MWU16-30316]TFZ37803.1 hypothetical protein EWW49_00365 [Pseudomonas syringae]
MAEINTVAVDLHVKRYSDFDLLRIAKAVNQDYEGLITAYLVSVHIHACSAVGVVFGHLLALTDQRLADGRLIRTSDIQSVTKEGRFWVITTVNSKYVIATFRREVGRHSLREFMHLQSGGYLPTPDRLQ